MGIKSECEGVDFLFDLEEELYERILECLESHSRPYEFDTFKIYLASSLTCIVISILQSLDLVASCKWHKERFKVFWNMPPAREIMEVAGFFKIDQLEEILKYAIFLISMDYFDDEARPTSVSKLHGDISWVVCEIILRMGIADIDVDNVALS